MASPTSNLNQWMHNRSLLPIIPTTHPDWLVTVAFYAALHLIDALLISDGVRTVTSHGERNDVLSHTNRYSKIATLYLPLYGLSRTVRYMPDNSRWVPASKVDSEVFRRYLYPIEKSALGLMRRAADVPPPITLLAATPQ